MVDGLLASRQPARFTLIQSDVLPER